MRQPSLKPEARAVAVAVALDRVEAWVQARPRRKLMPRPRVGAVRDKGKAGMAQVRLPAGTMASGRVGKINLSRRALKSVVRRAGTPASPQHRRNNSLLGRNAFLRRSVA